MVDFFLVEHKGADIDTELGLAGIKVTIADQGESNSATVTVNNSDGRFNDPFFKRFDQVEVSLGVTDPPKLLLRGFIFGVSHSHKGINDLVVELDIRGPEHILMRRRATEEFTSIEAAQIIRNITDTYFSDLLFHDAGSIIDSGVVYDKVQYQRQPNWGIYKSQSMTLDYTTRLEWVSASSKWKVNFKPISTISSGKILSAEASGAEIQIRNMQVDNQGVAVLNSQHVFGGEDAVTTDPIAKRFDDFASQSELPGLLEGDDFRDDNISSSAWAKDIARSIVRANKEPRRIITCDTDHLEGLDVGETVVIQNSLMGVDEEVTVRTITYNWKGGDPEYTCNLTLNEIPKFHVMDAVTKLKEDIDLLKGNSSDTSSLERVLLFPEALELDDEITVTRFDVNESWIWGAAKWGRNKWGDNRTQVSQVII